MKQDISGHYVAGTFPQAWWWSGRVGWLEAADFSASQKLLHQQLFILPAAQLFLYFLLLPSTVMIVQEEAWNCDYRISKVERNVESSNNTSANPNTA